MVTDGEPDDRHLMWCDRCKTKPRWELYHRGTLTIYVCPTCGNEKRSNE